MFKRGISKAAVAALCTSFVVVAVPSVPVFAAVTPSVALSSAQLLPLIGEQVTFNVAFDNTGSGEFDTGYGPYVDVRFDAGGADGDDGITFSSATYLGAALAPKATFNCTGTPVVHPLTGVTLGCPVGEQLIVVQLPYGSFTADQPIADIGITANVSNLADVATPQLTITATPGFAYGDSPTGSTPIGGSVQQIDFTPQVLRFAKTYIGPEQETATGPNYPRRFRLSVDIADGQRVNNLTITDRLPTEYQFVSVISKSGPSIETLPSTLGPAVDNELVEVFTGSAGVTTGTSSNEDAFVLFEYFIPDNDATPAPIIDPTSGDDELTRNDGQASGTVDPLDPRDADQPFTIDPNSLVQPYADDAEMTAKSIAVQKSVANVSQPSESGAIPGDTLQYTIRGQISDYFTFAGIVVNDVLGDGQTFDGLYTPTLTVTEQGALPASVSLASSFAVDVTDRATPCGPRLGTTKIDFAVSSAYAAHFVSSGGNGAGGIFTGGRVDGSTGPATFEITFRAVVDDSYTCMPTEGNKLDSRDFVTNTVTVTGEVYDNTTQAPQAVPLLESDDSSTRVDIDPITLEKSIWARNGSTSGFSGSPARFAANDRITYRLMVKLPSSDFSGMSIGDYLPLPVLTATPLTQSVLPEGQCIADTAPAVGEWCYGPADTFHDAPGYLTPSVADSADGNSITWNYGTQEIADNLPRVIELLFTLTISDAPFREGLFLTNQAQMFESNSFGTQSTAPAIVQIELTEPFLNIDKGVVGTTHTGSGSSGTVAPPGVTFDAVGTACAPTRFTGTFNSGTRGDAPAANVTGLDAHDTVRFAIVVENTGTGLNGAFDVTISDAVPAGFQIPDGGTGLNLCVTDGVGTEIDYTPTGFFTGTPSASPLGTGTLALTDTSTGALAPYSMTSGENLAVITYELELVSDIGANTPAPSLTNTATITQYAATEGGPSFVSITPPADLFETASVASTPIAIDKTLISTSAVTTSGANVVIGEEVQYTVTVAFPEGLSRNVSVVDSLPPGLAISRTPGTAVVGSSLSATVGAPAVSGGGHILTYDVGDVLNSDTDNATQTNETITFTYWAAVLDVSDNQQNTIVSNSARVDYDAGSSGSAPASHTDSTPVTVIEPTLSVAKSASVTTVDASDPIRYTISVTNSSVAIGHEVTLTDTLPAGVNYVAASLTSPSGVAPTTLGISAGVITATWTTFPVSSSSAITFDVTVAANYDTVSAIANTATIAWTSLPGVPVIISDDANALERTGAGGVDDYTRSSTSTVQAVAPQIVKSLVTTDQATTPVNNVTIGEIVDYDLRVTLPDGAIGGFTVTDQIPNGLQYVAASVQVISTGAPLAQPFGGTLGTATPTGGASNGADLVVTFGATSNPADGNALNNSIVVRLRALVLNVAGNIGFGSSPTTLSNRGVVRIGASTSVSSAFVATPVVEPHLVITKTFAPTTASQGDTVTVNLAAQNNGLAIAHDVVISDALDSHFDEGLAAEGTTPAGFTYARTGNTVTYTAAPGTEIAAGATVNFSFTVPLDAVVPIGTAIPNTAIVTGESTIAGIYPGEREEPDTSSLTTLNSVGPDLQLTKDDHVTTVTPGTQTTYDLVVRNVGGFQATGVSIVDTLPAATTFVGVGGASCSDGGAPMAGARTINIAGAIAATNGTVTCTITIAITTPAPAGTTAYLNSATVTDDGVNGADPNPGDNTATDNDTISGRAPNLVVTKTDGETTRTPGQSTTYTVTVTNTGNIGVTNVAVTDSLPAGLTFVSCTPGTGVVSVACANNSGIVTISYASLAGAGGSASFTIVASVNNPIAEAIHSIDNAVTVIDDGANGTESNLADNTAHDIDTIDAVPDMVVVKSHPGTTNVAPGGTVTYELLVSNAGDQHATGVTVVDTVDPQMNINCGTVSPTPTSCNAGTGVITWGPGLTDAGTISGGGV
ncbi:MAG TPA: isopeptide-forming domain-containing fimbrial protein, partial [Ilumatobacteraceae bacterium]|nr:isopeptide-forming domain-containing fimbrial protein [Ilumatobacteraceae bacterium]